MSSENIVNQEEIHQFDNKYIKQEHSKEFVCILPAFESHKTLGGKFINIKQEKKEKEEPKNQLTSPFLQKISDPRSCKQKNKDNLICKVCEKGFKTNVHLKRHEKTHEDKVECSICKLKYSQASIENHIKLHELKKNGKKIKCNVCLKMFLTRRLLNIHVRSHNKFECDICGYKSAHKFHLQDHFETHLNPNAFQCKICDSKLGNRTSFNHHIRFMHKEVKNFEKHSCEVCHKEFKKKENLYHHKKTHEKHSCPICKKSLVAVNLKDHLKLHEAKKSKPKLECQICFKKFFVKKSLYQHQKMIHKAL